MITSFSGKHHFLSNFHPCRITFEGVEYPTSEHAYQAAKTTDPNWKQLIREADTPGKTKKLARAKDFPIVENWDEIKYSCMRNILMAKFLQNPELGAKLLETGTKLLVEGNWWGDTYWGVDSKTMEGQNRLGVLLMEVRNYLKENVQNDS